jgi:hypothetical protein
MGPLAQIGEGYNACASYDDLPCIVWCLRGWHLAGEGLIASACALAGDNDSAQ